MPQPKDTEDSSFMTLFTVALDDETMARLWALARVCENNPVSLASAILHDVLEDDELAHSLDSTTLQ